jgi:hypothetical protein
MAISFKEVIKNTSLSDIPHSHQVNIDELLKRVNIIREAYGKPMNVSSGYRSLQDHLRIYSQKGITDPNKVPMGSQHLSGEALDIADPKGELQAWIKAHPEIIEQANLYLEDFGATPTWVHMQIRAFKSYKPDGTRFFKP